MIGCGQIAQSHLRTYQSIPNAKVVACADINLEAAQRSAQEYGAEWSGSDFRQMLAEVELDAVDVCLHNNLHQPATEVALAAGKHVYCEKPIAGSYVDGLAMVQAAKKAGLKLHIQLSTLYSDETRAAQQLIADGELGHIYHARSSGFRRRGRPYVDGYGTPSFVQKRNASGGALFDMGIYHIAQVLHLLGNPTPERIVGRTFQEVDMDPARREKSGYDVEELALGLVRLEGGIALDIIESWAILLDKFEGSYLVGSKGGVRLSPFGFFKSFGNLDAYATMDLGNAAFRRKNVDEEGDVYANSQAHWVAALQGRVELLPTAQIALNVMLISEGIYLSEKLGREVTSEEVLQHSQSKAVAV